MHVLGFKPVHHSSQSTRLPDSINLHFLRKERLYTKLKYSRSPAFDIVSGGAAALLAGFIGFLISEKYGFELADSGDFYYLFMYCVFFGFSLKPLVTTVGNTTTHMQLLSVKPLISFYLQLFLIGMQFCFKKFNLHNYITRMLYRLSYFRFTSRSKIRGKNNQK